MPERSPLSADTSLEAARVYFATLRRLGPEGRWRLFQLLQERQQWLAEAGVRYRHPDYDAAQVRRAVIRLRLGAELFRRVYPGEEVQP